MGISYKRGRKRFQRREPRVLHRINRHIRVPEVRVVDETGELIGVMSTQDALNLSREKGVDLVEISAKAKPPVCKIVDYGKMLYAQKKKDQKTKQANKKKELKGIRITFAMAEGDLARQRKHAEEFLVEGHPVRIQLRMRGREKAHKNLAFEKLKGFLTSLGDISKIDQAPKMGGGQLVATLAPAKKSTKLEDSSSS